MGTTTAATFVGLGIAWLVLLWLTFRYPGSPRMGRLMLFQGLMWVTFILAYLFLLKVFHYNPNPGRVKLAGLLTQNRMIYLGDIVPGLYDLDYIHLVDTDGEDESTKEEWLAFYQYDVEQGPEGDWREGPFGAAIYDPDDCRPPSIQSFELVPVSYDYLAQDAADVYVQNLLAYPDPESAKDYPEVLIYGFTRGILTDLNVFRRAGITPSCLGRTAPEGGFQAGAAGSTVRYENIGSFRGTEGIQLNGATVTVLDRDPLERSQITIRRDYRPESGSYYYPGTQTLMDPVEEYLSFGPAWPDDIPKVYYPEKAVLAFYLLLGKDRKNLETAESYLSSDAQQLYDIRTDPFGLSTHPDDPAKARAKLARVMVQGIKYAPDIEAEKLHQNQYVTVDVLGVNEKGEFDPRYRCEVTWTVVGVENPGALPYGCEWGLDSYWSTCEPRG